MTEHDPDQLHFHVGTLRVPYVPLDDMDFRELRLVKHVSGVPPMVANSARFDGDGDAWQAFILVAVQRVNPKATVSDLDRLKLADVIKEFGADEDDTEAEEDEASPPAESGDKPQPKKPKGSTSGQETTPE